MAVEYEVLVGLNYPPDKRAEVGDVVGDLPGKSLTWLLAEGLVRPISATAVPAEPAAPTAPTEAGA